MMNFEDCSRQLGTRLLATMLLITAGTAGAETIFTVNGVPVDSAVVDAYFASRLGAQGGQATPEQREILMQELRDIYILTTQDNVEALAADPQVAAQIELQKRGILAQAVAADFFNKVDISEEELLASYNEQVRLSPPLQFKARHILLESQGEAIEVINQLDGGSDFADLAREKSIGPTGPNGGDLDWFSPNTMVQPFSEAVTALEDGQYSKEPVQTQFGWHVILREDSREQTPPTFEASREQIEAAVRNQKFQEHIQSLRNSTEQ
ncbi:MAG: peptidylprolyl isomerase [Acidiferrobacterales bacterium]|nr:peptidylprolyl isomerase [Acidiferrobacterales bacterium]